MPELAITDSMLNQFEARANEFETTAKSTISTVEELETVQGKTTEYIDEFYEKLALLKAALLGMHDKNDNYRRELLDKFSADPDLHNKPSVPTNIHRLGPLFLRDAQTLLGVSTNANTTQDRVNTFPPPSRSYVFQILQLLDKQALYWYRAAESVGQAVDSLGRGKNSEVAPLILDLQLLPLIDRMLDPANYLKYGYEARPTDSNEIGIGILDGNTADTKATEASLALDTVENIANKAELVKFRPSIIDKTIKGIVGSAVAGHGWGSIYYHSQYGLMCFSRDNCQPAIESSTSFAQLQDQIAPNQLTTVPVSNPFSGMNYMLQVPFFKLI